MGSEKKYVPAQYLGVVFIALHPQTLEPRAWRVRTCQDKEPILLTHVRRLFYGVWPDHNGRGETKLLVEQVSHHPPITAYVIENKKKGIKLVGHNAQKTSFTCKYSFWEDGLAHPRSVQLAPLW